MYAFFRKSREVKKRTYFATQIQYLWGFASLVSSYQGNYPPGDAPRDPEAQEKDMGIKREKPGLKRQ